MFACVREPNLELHLVWNQMRKFEEQIVVDVRDLDSFALRLERDRPGALDPIQIRLESRMLARPRQHVAAAEPDVAIAARNRQRRELGLSFLPLLRGPSLNAAGLP
jgi:hypothetical protein